MVTLQPIYRERKRQKYDRSHSETRRHPYADRVYLVSASVDSVDLTTRTCNVTTISGRESTAIESVRLMASLDDGVLIVPTIGSTIFVTYSDFNVPFVALFSEVDQVLFISGSSQLSIVDGKIMLNDGSYGGLVEVTALVTKLNNLENLVNDLITKYNAHTHILTLSSGSGTAAPTATAEGQTLTPTQRGDIENTLITHGK